MDRCQLWIGANNWDPAVDANNVYFASDQTLAPNPLMINDIPSDGNTENCVVANGAAHAQQFDDFHCQCWKFDFICENTVQSPPCDDLSESEVDLEGWCEAGYERPQCPAHCITEDCQCMQMEGDMSMSNEDQTMKVIIPQDECLTWPEAQQYCCEVYGGKLWEPQDNTEYTDIYNQYINFVSINFREIC